MNTPASHELKSFVKDSASAAASWPSPCSTARVEGDRSLIKRPPARANSAGQDEQDDAPCEVALNDPDDAENSEDDGDECKKGHGSGFTPSEAGAFSGAGKFVVSSSRFWAYVTMTCQTASTITACAALSPSTTAETKAVKPPEAISWTNVRIARLVASLNLTTKIAPTADLGHCLVTLALRPFEVVPYPAAS